MRENAFAVFLSALQGFIGQHLMFLFEKLHNYMLLVAF